MSDNPTLDFLVERLNEKGWLSISTLYFDNSYCMNIYTSRGYVAFSPSRNLFFSYNCLDTTDSKVVENTYAILDRVNIGQQQNITVAGSDCLQHFDIAQYSHYDHYYYDEQEKTPYPDIPTKDTIMGFTLNPDTGLYENADIAHMVNDTEVSVYPLYPKEKEIYSGAIIANWQRFYKNQEKFCKMLGEAYGVTDAM